VDVQRAVELFGGANDKFEIFEKSSKNLFFSTEKYFPFIFK
jgi:hypothetical protein